jgi:hypothetical protein
LAVFVATMSEEPFWKQLADTRHRVQLTKLHLRTDAAHAAAAEEAKFSVSVDYPDGTKALRFDDDGVGFVYYPSGNVAVCVSRFSEYQLKFFFYGDDTKGTLIGFSSEKSEGFALSPDRKVLWNCDGGSIVGGDGSVQRRWRWDPTKQNAGSPPTDPVTVYLNEALQCTFLSRQACTFKFTGTGVAKEFDCSEKLRRCVRARVRASERACEETGVRLRRKSCSGFACARDCAVTLASVTISALVMCHLWFLSASVLLFGHAGTTRTWTTAPAARRAAWR